MVVDPLGCAEHRLGTTALEQDAIFRALSHPDQKRIVTFSECSAVHQLLRNGERDKKKRKMKRKTFVSSKNRISPLYNNLILPL